MNRNGSGTTLVARLLILLAATAGFLAVHGVSAVPSGTTDQSPGGLVASPHTVTLTGHAGPSEKTVADLQDASTHCLPACPADRRPHAHLHLTLGTCLAVLAVSVIALLLGWRVARRDRRARRLVPVHALTARRSVPRPGRYRLLELSIQRT